MCYYSGGNLVAMVLIFKLGVYKVTAFSPSPRYQSPIALFLRYILLAPHPFIPSLTNLVFSYPVIKIIFIALKMFSCTFVLKETSGHPVGAYIKISCSDS